MSAAPTPIHLSLPTARPFAADALLAFLAGRALDSLEVAVPHHGVPRGLRRAVRTPHGHGIVTVEFPVPAHEGSHENAGGDCTVDCWLQLSEPRDLDAMVAAVRAWLDLDADPVSIDAHLASDPHLAAHVGARPGLRVPGTLDAFETACRAVIGQQVSVAGARTVASRLVHALGEPLHLADAQLTRLFPGPATILGAPDELFAMPAARRSTLRTLAQAVLEGAVDLEVRADNPPTTIRATLLALKGIGPWTADYIALRALGDHDVFLGTDLGVVRAMADAEGDPPDPTRWQPYRSYALHHLWQTPLGRT